MPTRYLSVLGATILLALGATQVCAQESSSPGMVVQGFTADVTDEEWAAAVPVKDVGAPEPKQVTGPKRPIPPRDAPIGQRIFVTVAVVIRQDGTQGVYKVLRSNHVGFAKNVVAMLRKQRFTPVTWQGRVVSVRGEESYEVVATERREW